MRTNGQSTIWLSVVMAITMLTSTLIAGLDPRAGQAVSGSLAAMRPTSGETCTTLQPGPSIGKDAYIKQEKQDERRGGDSELRVKTENGKLMRALMQFDLSSIPPTAIVNSATLSLYVKGASGGSVTINAHGITASWTEAEVTWNARDKAASVLWTNLGGDYNAAVAATASLDDTKNVWRSWNLTSLVSSWLAAPASNLGVILESPVTNPKTEKIFRSSDDGTATQRPKLVVCYSAGVTLTPNNTGEGVAGQTKTYAHVVRVGNLTTVVNLAASSSQGWVQRIYNDVNGNGVKDPEDTIISQTPSIGPNVDYFILVQVDVPSVVALGTTDVTTITATAQATGATATATDSTRVGQLLVVKPDFTRYAVAGSVNFYGHTITNNGNSQDCVNVTSSSSQGWTVLLWEDTNQNGVHETNNPNEPALSNPVCIAAGATYHLVAEIRVPAGATVNTVDQTVITATSGNDPSKSDGADDVTTVFDNSPPVIDGRYDDVYRISPDATQVCYIDQTGALFGKLASFYQPSGNSVYMVLAIDKDFVDNTYGANAVNWPSGHSFGNLTGSDHAQFWGLDANGTKVLDFDLDYISSKSGTPSGYASLGVAGGDGGMNTGSAANIQQWGTSFDYTLNNFGYCSGGNCSVLGTNLTVNSPATDVFYTPNPTYPDWIYDVIYEVKVAKTAFGASGFGSIEVPYIHASPSKIGTNTIYAEPGVCPGEIGDTVWYDTNHDGVQQVGEAGINDVQVKLYRDNGDGFFNPATDTVVATQTTRAGGKYLFQNLRPDDYFVDVVDATIPDGYVITTNNDPTPMISLAEGQSYLEADFGYTLAYPDLLVTKRLTTPGPVYAGQEVSFTIGVTNTGLTSLSLIPLRDWYDPTILDFVSATPQPDSVGTGTLTWNNLAMNFLNGLAPGESVAVVVRFRALQPTAAVLGASKVSAVPASDPAEQQKAQGANGDAPTALDTCGYPYSSANPLTSVVFNESTVLRGFKPVDGGVARPGDTLNVWYNDEHALTLGVRQVKVKTSSGTTTTDYPITPLATNPGSAFDPLLGTTALTGDQAGTDVSDRPMWPAIFITDITTDPNNRAGDWQWGGAPLGPHAVFGTWKGAVRLVDKTRNPPTVTVTPDSDPAKNNWNLGSGDPAPPGLINEGYGAEVRWNVDRLVADGRLISGHTYRFQFMVHDGDQNKTGGDVGEACTTITLAPTGSIGDRVWYDLNGDKLQQSTEPGLNGVKVELYGGSCPLTGRPNGTPLKTLVTAVDGNYDFANLSAGSYCVAVDASTLPTGFALTTANEPLTVLLANLQDYNDADFGYRAQCTNGTPNLATVTGAEDQFDTILTDRRDFACVQIQQALGAIGDFVWYDKNQDGIEDVGEPGIANVTVALYRDTDGSGTLTPGDTLVATTTTDADGGYIFKNLPTGVYFVDVTDANNVLAGLAHIVANQSKPDPTAAITLGAGQVYKDADFGYVRQPTSGKALIGDTVWYDDNGDGVQQPSEPGIPGIQVCATPVGGGTPICTTTDSNGHYLIEVPAGSYTVAPTNPPAGYTATTIVPHPVSVAAGEQYLNADFGYNDNPSQPQLGTIGNLVFRDVGTDGVCGSGDSPLAGVSVDLIRDSNANGVWNAGEPIIATVTTTPGTTCTAGNYQFTGLPAGRYLVHVSDTNAVLVDYTKSPLGAAGVDNNNQADPYAVNLPAAGSNQTADFGYYPQNRTNIGVIGNQVWIEYDANGIFNPTGTDVGQAGVTVELLQGNVVIATTTTGASGDYAFTSLPAGSYQVRVSDTFKVLKDYVLTVLGPNPGQDNNHQAQPYAVSLPAGGYNLTADFGYTKLGAIGDFVWYDTDRDGIEDVGEPGIPNVTVALYRDTDGSGALSAGDTLVATTVTDADGGYIFKNVIPGVYFVDVTDANNVLAGLTHIVANQSKPDPTGAIVLGPGQVYKDADFGYYKLPGSGKAIIGDTVWYDDNGDGIQQPGEPGIPGIQVCATPVGGGAPLCATTDSNGHYLIEAPAGSYTVAPTNPPAGFTATTIVPHPVTLQIGQTYLDADFGYNDNPSQPQLGTVGDLVFRDVNKDGVCNSGDSVFTGVSMDLIRDSNANSAWDAGEPIIATVTTVGGTACTTGNYLFTGVPAGRYLVHVSDTNAVLFDYTKSPLGTAGANNNNQADPYAINLAAGGSNLTADFGYYPLDHTNIGVIGNQVWTEKDYNGLYNANGTDAGQAGVTVQLLKNGTVIATTTTGASGDYAFVSLPGGTYQVRVSDSFGVLAGYVVTVLGPNPGQDNNNQAQPYQVTLPTGGYNLTADFGYIKLGAIGDFVWYDTNRDGIEDVGEPGIPNVTVALYRDTDGSGTLTGGDTLVGTLTTDADGGYLFNNLPPATYFVDVTDANNVLAGLTHIVANQSQPDPTGAIVLAAGQVYKNADFGYVQTPNTGKAIIGDTVWYDDNGDGVQQPGEPGIPNVQVCATSVAGGAPICDTTDSNGHYLIEVPPGSYSVAPTNPPPGYTATTPVPHVPVVVLAGDQYLKADFGYDDAGNNFLGAIGNLVFLDANKDGVYNAGDTPFPGVSVDLIRDSNNNGVWDAGEPIIATATTASTVDANTGNYLFSGLTAGRYLVHVSDTNGVLYGYTKSPLGAAGVNNNNQADPYAVNLPVGADNLTADFGYFLTDRPMGAIGNQVWIETDNNGLFNENSGDYGQHGVTVQLRQNGVVIATTTTGASGDYVFVGLQAGSYDVRVSDALGVLTAYIPTVVGPNPGQDNNNQAQPYAVTLAQGQFNPTADFGYTPGPDVRKDSTIGNLVWVDRNADGLYTADEPGIGNVSVQLWYDSNRNCARDQFDFLVDTKLTAASAFLGGNYRFNGDFPAGNYIVIVTDTNNVLTTYTKSTGPNPGQDNNSQAMPYCIQNFNPTNVGATNLTADFGYWQPVTVGDFTWVDVNGNNVYDPGVEPPLSGVIIQVKNSSNVVVATVTTGPTGGFPAGTYLVTGLPPGRYTATVIPQPNGYLPSGPTTLTSVLLLSGQSDLTLDFPFISPTSVLVANFTADQQPSGYVNLAWTTLAEGANEGFHVWRATSADGVYQRLTTTPIASQASGAAGASYTWVDEAAVAGKVYFYRLETLPAGQLIGPVASRLSGMQLFMPWLRR